MSEQSIELLQAVRDIRELLRLIAEPAVEARDGKLRQELRRIVGASARGGSPYSSWMDRARKKLFAMYRASIKDS